MSSAGDLRIFGHAGIALLVVETGCADGRWDGVVLLACDDQQRAKVGVVDVDLGFGEWVTLASTSWNNGMPDAATW